jgi:hypothetical protein
MTNIPGLKPPTAWTPIFDDEMVLVPLVGLTHVIDIYVFFNGTSVHLLPKTRQSRRTVPVCLPDTEADVVSAPCKTPDSVLADPNAWGSFLR